MIGSPGLSRRYGPALLVCVLPLAASCTVGKAPDPPVIGSWKAGASSIQLLEGGKLGEVLLLPAMCRGDNSPTAVKFTGTWKYGKLQDAGTGAIVQLASLDGYLRCERYFQYGKGNNGEQLGMTGVDAGQEPFVRQ
ncbi:hypothetical protein [Streptomyces sp. CBMA156]|uniref:hypothetical protein n=1 Tax=Streptomyces sp. CBMA156 TaxID=1930280 RepID=UPI0016619D95|nr:hypothetical protein [Streptomyces sp. CBMA156]MBD0674354.1 hypothetical protein [Streptomyces sp. CBMA156]MBD0676274.1 hypothetical protein [Streptomyces sp. CBMA156]